MNYAGAAGGGGAGQVQAPVGLIYHGTIDPRPAPPFQIFRSSLSCSSNLNPNVYLPTVHIMWCNCLHLSSQCTSCILSLQLMKGLKCMSAGGNGCMEPSRKPTSMAPPCNGLRHGRIQSSSIQRKNLSLMFIVQV